MMTVRELAAQGDPVSFEAIAQILASAYPITEMDSPEKLVAFAENLRKQPGDPGIRLAVAESDGTPVGVMKLYDYVMNVRGTDAAAGGVGAVAVALDRKRSGIARTMILWYLEDYRRRGAAFAVLHAFRPDFYRKLGFGYGTPMHRYRFAPETLNTEGAVGSARFLTSNDTEALLACCERVRSKTNGLFAKHALATAHVLAGQKPRYVGVEEGGVLRGFMQTSVTLGKPGTANANELVVRDLHAESPGAQSALFAYLSAQRDQFARIVLESQDDALFLATSDPRDGENLIVAPPAAHRVSETGLGIMYRLLDVPKAFAHLAVPRPSPFVLRVVSEDAIYAPTNGTWTFAFGGPSVVPAEEARRPDATLRIGSADLASLVVGSLGLRALVRHRRAFLEPESALGEASALFEADAPPRCETRF